MTVQKRIAIAALGLACMSLSGCFGSNGGGGVAGGGGGGGTPPGTTFQENFDRVSQRIPTQQPLSGSASYSGQVEILTGLDDNDPMESVVGDLTMDVNFDGVDDPIDATATNFAGTLGGEAVTIDGTLTSAASTNDLNEVTAQESTVPNVGTITSTGMVVELAGTLTEPTNQISGDALLTLQGVFNDDQLNSGNATGAFGAAGLALQVPGEPGVITGGTWYVDRN